MLRAGSKDNSKKLRSHLTEKRYFPLQRPPALLYVGCPGSIQPFWISREPVTWPWCNLAASQRRPYCASVSSHSPVGLVSRQWEAVYSACVLCDRRFHNDRASRSDNSLAHSTAFVRAFFLAKHQITQQVCQPPYSLDLAPCDFWLFPKLKSLLKGKKFVSVVLFITRIWWYDIKWVLLKFETDSMSF